MRERGRSVLDLAGTADAAAALGGLSGQAVTGTAVRVLTVPADEGFWVGTSDQQRTWIQLTGEAGESPYQVTEGDTVYFEGAVVTHDQSFAGAVGVDEAEGAAQLTAQGAHRGRHVRGHARALTAGWLPRVASWFASADQG